MTVTTTEARVNYDGDSITTVFPYPYKFFDADDLRVYTFDEVTEDAALLTLNIDYSVTGAGVDAGGTVTTTVAPATGLTLIIINDPDMVQEFDYVNADDFPAESHEEALDRLTKICQRLADRLDRCVRSPDYVPEADVPDAESLLTLVEDAQEAADESEGWASQSESFKNDAVASANAAANSANASVTAANSSISAAAAAATSATNADSSADEAAASAAAAQVSKIEWKGAWSAGTAYLPNDAAQVGGSSYISKTSNTNQSPPSSPTHWDLMAQRGADGSGGGGSGDMLRANNLSDVLSVSTSRSNLGLKGAAILDVGQVAGTVAAGDDSRFTALASADTAINAAIALKADLASPVFTGDPRAPTATFGDNDTTLANTAFVQAAVSDLPAGSIDFDELNATAIATAAQYRANTASKLLTTDKVWAAAAAVALTDGATITPDFSTGFDFQLTLGAAGRTLANPTNAKEGQKGLIYIVQDATGGRTITSWGTNWKFPGGTKPTLTATGNAFDILSYVVGAGGSPWIFCTFAADFK